MDRSFFGNSGISGSDAATRNPFQVDASVGLQAVDVVNLNNNTVTPSNRNKRVILPDISPIQHKRTTGHVNGAITPDSLHINPRSLHNRGYLPNHIQNHLVYSCIDWKWRAKDGKQLDSCLHEAVHDELNREKTSWRKKTRAINIDLLANILWSLMAGRSISCLYFQLSFEEISGLIQGHTFEGMPSLYEGKCYIGVQIPAHD
jgi:hypothetical protein